MNTDDTPAPVFAVGDRVTCDFYRGAPATVTALLITGGFAYTLDKPHDLGPRYGQIVDGKAFDTNGWRHWQPETMEEILEGERSRRAITRAAAQIGMGGEHG